LTIWKKAVSVATSAALLASLLATAVAPGAFAADADGTVGLVGGAVTVPVDGAAATTNGFSFTEKRIDDFPATGFTLRLDILNAGVTFDTSSAIVKSAPTSLGLTATYVDGNTIEIKASASDTLNKEPFSISGLKYQASDAAVPDAILVQYTITAGAPAGQFTALYFGGGTNTATGTLVADPLFAGSTSVEIDLTSPFCFQVTDSVIGNGSLNFNDGTDGATTESRSITAAGAFPCPDPQTITLGLGTSINHDVDTEVTQTVVVSGFMPSPGTVQDSLIYNDPGGKTRINAGETNQGVLDLSASERTAGFLAKGKTITLTIATAGVTFSVAPNADVTGGVALTLTGATTGSSNIYGVLAADHKSVTWTVATKSTTAASIRFDDISYDVASTVATGTSVDVTLATSAGTVVPTSRSNAVIGRVLTVTATTPNVYIGENNQTAGQVTIVETGPGFFIAGAGNKNTFAICLGDPTEGVRFATAPWAKVTAGDLVLREGDVASTDKVVLGKAIVSGNPEFGECYYWTVWTKSITASTIVISGDEAGTLGVKINVPAGLAPGPVEVGIRTGDVVLPFFNNTLEARVSIANKVFRNQVLVTALSQPVIPAGAGNALAGNIQIAETANGQLKDGQFICVEVLPRASNDFVQDTFLKGLTTADMPLATASGGVVVSSVTMSTQRCSTSSVASNLFRSFSFRVNQQSITGTGKIVISNIHYGTTADAPFGPVLVNVWALGASNTQLDLQGVISNARIGVKPAITIRSATALGQTMIGPFTTPTKTAALNQRITWRFSGGSALAGKRVQIWVATRNADGSWGAWSRLTGRTADGAGNAFFWTKYDSAKRISVRAFFPGDATYGASWSPSGRQGVWR